MSLYYYKLVWDCGRNSRVGLLRRSLEVAGSKTNVKEREAVDILLERIETACG
jgi:hypothetical protein